MSSVDRYFLRVAAETALFSRDPSTKVGCVIANGDARVSTGWNRFARGVDDYQYLYDNREAKLARTVHAEVDAIISACCSVYGMTMYTTLFPCSHCAPIIIQAGIAKVISPFPDFVKMERWKTSWELSQQLFKEAKVGVLWYPDV